LCRENIYIPNDKPCIILEGSDRITTIISHGDKQATTTFVSNPPNVILSGITFEVNTTKRARAITSLFFIEIS